MMKVICISNTSIYTGAKLYLNIGQTYFIDRSSIYMDTDGDAFGVVHNAVYDEHLEDVGPGTIVGNMALKHFQSII